MLKNSRHSATKMPNDCLVGILHSQVLVVAVVSFVIITPLTDYDDDNHDKGKNDSSSSDNNDDEITC